LIRRRSLLVCVKLLSSQAPVVRFRQGAYFFRHITVGINHKNTLLIIFLQFNGFCRVGLVTTWAHFVYIPVLLTNLSL